jgi:hypothetical protein
MDGGIVVFFLVVTVSVGLAIWGAISPRSQWEVMQSWAFKNPEANEPSDAAFAVTRLANIVVLVLLVVAAVGLWSSVTG